MAEQWKIGDEVQLMSRGRVMTVTALNVMYSGNVECSWFDNQNKCEAVFPPEALTRYVQDVL
jgi:uncharacterized protein YodC (DUF2158 family)